MLKLAAVLLASALALSGGVSRADEVPEVELPAVNGTAPAGNSTGPALNTTLAVDCDSCRSGICYSVVQAENYTAAREFCWSKGGLLARLSSSSGSFSFVAGTVLPKNNVSSAYIQSWNGDIYNGCPSLIPDGNGNGSVSAQDDTCGKSMPAVCQFFLEGEFQKCAKCTDQCFAKTGKCIRFKVQDFTEAKAREACESDGGKLWNGEGAEEFYFVNSLMSGKSIKKAFADGYNGDGYSDACIAMWLGTKPEAGEGGAMTAWGCDGPLPAICEYKNSTKGERCQDPLVEIDPRDFELLAAKFPSPSISIQSAASAAAAVVSVSTVAFVAAMASILM